MPPLRPLAAAAILALAAPATVADEPRDVHAELDALRQQVERQAEEIRRLRGDDDDTWLDQRRSEQVRALVQQVVDDADQRRAPGGGLLTAGWRDGFFLASKDGDFLLRLDGQVQMRYVFNRRRNDPDPPPDFRRNNHGFELRRAKIGLSGHVFEPELTFRIRGNFSDFALDDQPVFAPPAADDPLAGSVPLGRGGAFELEDAWFDWRFHEQWALRGGQFKAPFLREERVYGARQLAVERSNAADLFTVQYTQGVQFAYTDAAWRAAAMIHDGTRRANTSFLSPAVDFAVAARGEILLAGNWRQFEDFTTWSGQPLALMLGGAIDYENAQGGDPNTPADLLKWTVDASAELPEPGLNLFAAVIGSHPRSRGDAPFTSADQFAAVAQAGAFVIPDRVDVFGRYEFVNLDGATPAGAQLPDGARSRFHAATLGANYYFQRHSAKATLDLVYYFNPVPISNPGAGILASTRSSQAVLRAQFQFLF